MACHLLIKLLKDVERLLALSLIGEQALAVSHILHPGQQPYRGSKIHQDPGRHARKRRNSPQHSELVFVEPRLIFLGPSLTNIAMGGRKAPQLRIR